MQSGLLPTYLGQLGQLCPMNRMQQKNSNILSVKNQNGFRSLELEDFNLCGMTIKEWCSISADLTNNELIILPFSDCIIIIIIFNYSMQLAVSNQLYVLLLLSFQGRKTNYTLLFLYKTQQECSLVVIRVHILLHTLQIENIAAKYL